MWWTRYKLEPGDIVTEIKMNVGQNSNSRSPLPSLASGNSRSSLPSLARVPQPIDVSTAPLAGMPRGPPIVSNIVTRRPNPVTVRTHHMFSRILDFLFMFFREKKVVFSIKITVLLAFSDLFWFLNENLFSWKKVRFRRFRIRKNMWWTRYRTTKLWPNLGLSLQPLLPFKISKIPGLGLQIS